MCWNMDYCVDTMRKNILSRDHVLIFLRKCLVCKVRTCYYNLLQVSSVNTTWLYFKGGYSRVPMFVRQHNIFRTRHTMKHNHIYGIPHNSFDSLLSNHVSQHVLNIILNFRICDKTVQLNEFNSISYRHNMLILAHPINVNPIFLIERNAILYSFICVWFVMIF